MRHWGDRQDRSIDEKIGLLLNNNPGVNSPGVKKGIGRKRALWKDAVIYAIIGPLIFIGGYRCGGDGSSDKPPYAIEDSNHPPDDTLPNPNNIYTNPNIWDDGYTNPNNALPDPNSIYTNPNNIDTNPDIDQNIPDIDQNIPNIDPNIEFDWGTDPNTGEQNPPGIPEWFRKKLEGYVQDLHKPEQRLYRPHRRTS